MIYCMSLDAYNRFSDSIDPKFPDHAFYDQFRIRYNIFIEHFNWAIHRDDVNKIEYDDFDRPNTIYHFCIDEETGELLGAVRSNSTLHPYMLEVDRFKEGFYEGFVLPKSSKFFEGSRIVINPRLYHPPKKVNGQSDEEYVAAVTGQKVQRRRIVAELFLSQMEVGFDMGIEAYVGTMWPEVHATTFGRIGWDLKFMGPETVLYDELGHPLDNGKPTQNLIYPVNKATNEKVRKTTGIWERITTYGVPEHERKRMVEFLIASANSPEPDARRAECMLGTKNQQPSLGM